MPNYTFKNIETQEEYTITLSISERDEYVKKNEGKVTQVITTALSLGDPIRLGIRKPDQNFRDVLREIKKAHPRGGGVNTF